MGREMGQCEYLTCRSALGSEFRCMFLVDRVPGHGGRWLFQAILLCPDHTYQAECDRAASLAWKLTEEGWVYPDVWIRSLFTAGGLSA